MVNVYSGKPTDYQDNMVDAIPTLKARAIKGDPSAMFAVIKDLAKVRKDSHTAYNHNVHSIQLSVFCLTIV